ncbi:MAG: glycosyl hydrolase family 17, partial [Cytophagales bacterium]|nr:glycosyl hydrolase family 17 [Cytophagales bacterium]
MKSILQSICFGVTMLTSISCHQKKTTQVEQPLNQKEVTAKDILGNPNYQAICYEGYREKSRELQPSIAQLQEDLKILSAVGIKIVRTYNVQLAHASNLLKAIQELKGTDPNFEMYVMLGAWIDCKNAWTDQAPDHNIESEQNEGEIGRA